MKIKGERQIMELISEVFKSIIEFINVFTKDYGIAIVVITIIMRALMIPLNIKQRQKLKEQEKISKAVEIIKEKYKNNEQKQQEELANYYKQNGTGMGSCLLSFIQLPIMIGLYRAINSVATLGTATVVLPWVSSIIAKDQLFILPIATLVVQLLPQAYPYFKVFKGLDLKKTPMSMMMIMNCAYIFIIPSGVGLYCFASGVFVAVEQLIVNFISAYRGKGKGVAVAV